MKIDKIQDFKNYQGNSNNKSSVSFQKRRGELATRIIETLPNKKSLKWMEKLEWLKGEAGGILITAIGTGAVAPWPIAFNPFVKPAPNATPEEIDELKKTKKYTAFRQPISAILAVLFQLFALKPIDIICDIFFNKEKFSKKMSMHVDQSDLNRKSYIERTIKKEMKQAGQEKPSILTVFKDGWKEYKEKTKAFKELFEDKVEARRSEQINKVAEKFQKTGSIFAGKRTLDLPTLADLVNKQIDDYIKDAEKLRIDTDHLAFYTDRAETLINNETRLRKYFKNVDGKNAEQLELHLRNILTKEKDPKVIKIIEEILDRPEELRQNHIQRTLSRIDNVKKLCDGKFSVSKYFDVLGQRNTEVDRVVTRLRKAKIKDGASATQSEILNSIKKAIEHCKFDETSKVHNSIMHDTTTFSPNKAKLTEKVYKDITKQYRKFLENTYKGRNQIIKVIVGVCITLPITCNVLNWVYPRFMDKFFPELAGAKKASKAKEGK